MEPSASLAAAARWLQDEDLMVLPVVDGGILSGVLHEQDLARALAEGADRTDAIAKWVHHDPPVIHPGETGAGALRRFEQTGSPYLVVVDDRGALHGLLTPSRVVSLPHFQARPRTIGGMATPAGVYLTNGAIGAGVGPLALASTGAVLFGLFLVAGTAVLALRNVLAMTDIVPVSLLNSPWGVGGAHLMNLLLFFVGMRSLPLAGIHAAEHMVVHAIERGEDLEPEVVARMPRVHPRCGTNLAVAAMLFLGVFSIPWQSDYELRLLAAFLATLILFRPLGSFAQEFITTKPPTRAQIEMGIRSAKTLLNKVAVGRAGPPSVWQRIASSGVLLIIAGALAAQGVAWLFFEVFQVPVGWRPF